MFYPEAETFVLVSVIVPRAGLQEKLMVPRFLNHTLDPGIILSFRRIRTHRIPTSSYIGRKCDRRL